ncbi:MAG: MOSC domain-containing protein [Dehalococcoidales bacterium]|nr:MOSC domain-containing protein [Dehalococcoidales bacterium]
MKSGKVIAVCRSDKKGTSKDIIPAGQFCEGFGMVSDAHADFATNRQVSLLATESIAKMRKLGLDVGPGAFAENLTTEGIDIASLSIGTKVTVGKEVVLEISQIGKECHAGCAIFRQVGRCIMPKEGVFARVVKGGTIAADDEIKVTG